MLYIRMTSSIVLWIICSSSLCSIVTSLVEAEFLEITKYDGDDLHLNCSITSMENIAWKHRPTGNKNFFHISNAGKLYEKYTKYGRFRVRVDVDTQNGNYHLVVSSIKLVDAGTFICMENRSTKAGFTVAVTKIKVNLARTPTNSTVLVGHSVHFNCSTSLHVPVYWQHIPVQAESANDVYLGKNGLQGEYLNGGRHSVESPGYGQYNLVISNVSYSDAGTYICWNDSGLGSKASAELVVLGGRPSCFSNVSEASVLIVENNCGYDPDTVQLSCSIPFHGNIPVQLEWTNGTSISYLHTESNTINSSFVMSTVVMSAHDWIASTNNVRCQIKNSSHSEHACNIRSKNIGMATSFLPTSTSSVCLLNTTDLCLGDLSRFQQPTNILSQVPTHRLPSKFCSAVCDVRGAHCSLLYHLPFFDHQDTGSTNKESNVIGTTNIAIVILVLSTFVVILIVLWFVKLVPRGKTNRMETADRTKSISQSADKLDSKDEESQFIPTPSRNDAIP